MTPGAPPDRRALLHHVAQRLCDFGDLRTSDIVAVATLAGETLTIPRGTDVTATVGHAPHLVVSGWACQMRLHATRRRQIFGFLLPGDVVGSFWRRPDFTFYETVALTPLTLLSAQELMAEGRDGFAHGRLLDAARRAEEHAQHRLFDHIVRLGARDAYGGLAHLLLEFHARLFAVGLAHNYGFNLPVGQRVIAQAMGFSLAHTNHTLQRLSADGLVSMQGEAVRLCDPARLAALADFSDEVEATVSALEKPSGLGRRRAAWSALQGV